MSQSKLEATVVSTDDLSSVANSLRQLVTQLIHDSGDLTVDADQLRSLVSPVTRLYAACSEKSGYEIRAIDATVSTTDAVALACALIRAHNLNPFDLAIWYSRGAATERPGMPNEGSSEGLS